MRRALRGFVVGFAERIGLVTILICSVLFRERDRRALLVNVQPRE